MSIATNTSATPHTETSTSKRDVSTARLWTGRVISGLVILFLAFDAICKLLRVPMAVEASAKLGLSSNDVFGIGAVLLVCTVLYAILRTAALGALLLTGYLGGAVCTHVNFYDGAFPIVFAAGFGVLAWVGLGLRDHRVRALFAPTM